jgi:hypothetical protein
VLRLKKELTEKENLKKKLEELEEETKKKEEAYREKYNLANKRRQELLQERQEKAVRSSKPKQLASRADYETSDQRSQSVPALRESINVNRHLAEDDGREEGKRLPGRVASRVGMHQDEELH